jgi:leucyl aminopeptidase (aminopeptidase T)
VDPNTYKFLIRKCVEDATAAGEKLMSEVSSEVKTEEDSKDEVLDGLEKAEVKELEEQEEDKAAALAAEPDGVLSDPDAVKAKVKQEPTAKGGKGSKYSVSLAAHIRNFRY